MLSWDHNISNLRDWAHNMIFLDSGIDPRTLFFDAGIHFNLKSNYKNNIQKPWNFPSQKQWAKISILSPIYLGYAVGSNHESLLQFCSSICKCLLVQIFEDSREQKY